MIPTDLAPAGPRPAPTARGETAARTGDAGTTRAFARYVEGVPSEGTAAAETPLAGLIAPAEPAAQPFDAIAEAVEAAVIVPMPDDPETAIVPAATDGDAIQPAPSADATPGPDVSPDTQVALPAVPTAVPVPVRGVGDRSQDRHIGTTDSETPRPAAPADMPAPGSSTTAPVRTSVATRPEAATVGAADAEVASVTSGPEHSAPRPAFTGPATTTAQPVAPALAPQEATALASLGATWRLDEAQSAARAALGVGPATTSTASAREIAGQITLAVTQATQPLVEVRLDPPELGRVSIRLNPVEGGLQALVMAERPETQDFLRRHAEVLLRDLGAAGYDSVRLDFATGEGADRGDTRAERSFAVAAGPDPALVAPAHPDPPRLITPGRLDIRL